MIAKILSRTSGINLDIETLKTIIIFCALVTDQFVVVDPAL
jgi:hypothetical protein